MRLISLLPVDTITFIFLNGNAPWHIIVPSGVSKGNNQRGNCHIIIMRGIRLHRNNSVYATLHGNMHVGAELRHRCKSQLNHLLAEQTDERTKKNKNQPSNFPVDIEVMPQSKSATYESERRRVRGGETVGRESERERVRKREGGK